MHIRVSTAADIGKAIHTERKRQRLRQDDLAAMVESSHVFLRDVESGKPTVQLERVLRVLEELGISIVLDVPDAPDAEVTKASS
ncbi:MAG: helix-turn-helix domain-containing protein [Rhodanobacter sp.]